MLGTGTSGGVPSLGCNCEVCRSTDPHDKRLRSAATVSYTHLDVYKRQGYICHPVIAVYVVYAEEVETIYPQHHILQEGLLLPAAVVEQLIACLLYTSDR